MTPAKKRSVSPSPIAAPPAAREPEIPAATGGKARKPWIRRTPVEVVLDQIAKQEDRVRDLEEQLNREKRELQKLEGARRLLEGE